MAYQNVGKCRFYIDTISYLKTLGQDYTINFDNDLCTLTLIFLIITCFLKRILIFRHFYNIQLHLLYQFWKVN